MKKEKIPIANNIESEIVINNRYRKTLAMCSYKNGKYIISINKHILGSDTMVLEEIILHELIHTINGCFNHSPKFKKYCEILNKEYGYNLGTHTDEDKLIYDNTIKRIVYCCPGCNRQFSMFKSTNKHYQCPFCYSILEKQKNN